MKYANKMFGESHAKMLPRINTKQMRDMNDDSGKLNWWNTSKKSSLLIRSRIYVLKLYKMVGVVCLVHCIYLSVFFVPTNLLITRVNKIFCRREQSTWLQSPYSSLYFNWKQTHGNAPVPLILCLPLLCLFPSFHHTTYKTIPSHCGKFVIYKH